MSDGHSRRSSDSDLSPTTSLASSMVSMNTEDHNELYDHRQHPDPQPINVLNPHSSTGTGVPRSSRARNTPGAGLKPSRLIHSHSHQAPLPDENAQGSGGMVGGRPSLNIPGTRRGSKTHSAGENMQLPRTSKRSTHQVPKVVAGTTGGGRAMSVASTSPHGQRSRANSTVSASSVNPKMLISRTLSHVNVPPKQQQRRASFDSDDSKASRESQETEEDVCFPMQAQLHTRVNGIDFDELEEFAQASTEENQYVAMMNQQALGQAPQEKAPIFKNGASSSSTSTTVSSAALKYTPKQPSTSAEASPKNSYHNQGPGISFGHNRVEGDEPEEKYSKSQEGAGSYASGSPPEATEAPSQQDYYDPNFLVPDRFSFFSSESDETVHSTDIASLVKPGQHFSELFREGEPTWWLDCSCPTDDEMRCIAKAFGIHPLTAEDIRMQETREKVELFKSYYFVCFHTFESDHESADFLEPINVYIVVFRSGVLTFHFSPISHAANVRRRVRQLRDYVNVSSDWICYAIIDDITDSFAPVIQSLEYEADAIEDSVFMARDLDFSHMLQRIGESRRKTMTLMRLLSGKADVIKMFAKRCQDEANGIGPALTSQINIANLQAGDNEEVRFAVPQKRQNQSQQTAQPRGDIALYLGDIQDHLLTMFQNLLAYEKIFSRSHTNYLAQLQVESFNSNNKATEMLGKVTMLGTMLVPLNIIPGLFGMNVTVPGEAGNPAWWYGILGVMILLAIGAWLAASYWIKRIDPPTTLNEAAESGGKSVISSFLPKSARNQQNNRGEFNAQRGFLGHHQNAPLTSSNRSVASCPSKYSRYD